MIKGESKINKSVRDFWVIFYTSHFKYPFCLSLCLKRTRVWFRALPTLKEGSIKNKWLRWPFSWQSFNRPDSAVPAPLTVNNKIIKSLFRKKRAGNKVMEGHRRPRKGRRGEERGGIHIFITSSQELSIPNCEGLLLP